MFEDTSHDPAVVAAPLAKLQHAVVDVVGRPLVVFVGTQVPFRHSEDAQVASGHRQSVLQSVARLETVQTSNGAIKVSFTSTN